MSVLLDIIRKGGKPVIGMVQLPALATGAQYRGGGFAGVLDQAMSEARILSENGVDALMIQNLGDIPVDTKATMTQVAWMTRITNEVTASFAPPVGLNMLENDAEAMMAIASATAADFVRIKIYVGAMMTPFGLETAKAHAAIKARNLLNADSTAIFADVHDRTGTPLATGGFIEDVDIQIADGVRFIQLTPPGSACSISVGTGLPAYEGVPGSVRGLHLVVRDIAEARAELVSRGIDVSEVVDVGGGVKYAPFADPTATL